MSEPIKKYSPVAIAMEVDKRYSWCTCGHSINQPLCDGSHRAKKATPPLAYVATEEKTAYFCTCKLTKNPPFCDGSHKEI